MGQHSRMFKLTMVRKKAPAEYQGGRREFKVVLAGDKMSSYEETVRTGFNWKVVPTRPMNAGTGCDESWPVPVNCWSGWRTNRRTVTISSTGMREI